MKLKRMLGSILIGMGCVVLLIGGVAWYLPTVENRQMQLFVSSFRTPSNNWLIQQMNNGMNFAMEHGFLMLLLGLAIIAGGFLLTLSARTDAQFQTKGETHQAKPAFAAAPVAAPQAPAATIRTAPTRPAEENPFARYMKDGDLPKSTASPENTTTAESRSTYAVQEDESSRDDILNIWNKIQEQPGDSEELFIQPVQVKDDEAYRRPEEEDALPVDQPENLLTGEDWSLLDIDETPIQEAVSEPAPDPEPLAQPETSPKPLTVSPTLDKPRSIIRSTFRKSTVDQPFQAPAEETTAETQDTPAEAPMESPAEKAMEAPAPVPSSRIKSTMGRKR